MRCIKPLAPSRNETNSSRVNVGADGAILGICASGGRDQETSRIRQPALRIRFPRWPPSELFLAKTHQRASLSHGRGGGRLFGSGTGLGIAVSKMAA
jgi:hypothetical protein